MIRKLILSIFLIMFCLSACGGNEGNAEEGAEKPVDNTVYYTLLSTGVQSGIKQPGEIVITNQQQLDSIWALHYDYLENNPEPPDIDFEEEVVVGMFLGEKPTTGYWLRFDSVYRDKKDIIVAATTNEKIDESRAVLQVLTYPHFFIATEKPEGEVRFDLRAE